MFVNWCQSGLFYLAPSLMYEWCLAVNLQRSMLFIADPTYCICYMVLVTADDKTLHCTTGITISRVQYKNYYG